MFTLTSIYSQELSGRAGAFEDIGLGLRPLGMGGAYSALAMDENAARWNPALLSAVKDPIAGFTWTRQFALITYNYLSIAYPTKRDMGFGGFAVTSGDDVYRETTIGVAVGVPASRVKIPVDGLLVGVTLKILMTSFGNDEAGGEDRVTGTSTGLSLDIGFHWKMNNKFALALVSRELVNFIKWDSSVKGSYSEGLPRKLVLATAYKLEKTTLAFEYQPGLYGDTPDRIVAGAEVVLFKILRPRFGFAHNIDPKNRNRWLTAGLGMEIRPKSFGPIKSISFGYTQLFHDIDNSPRVGLVIGW